MMLVFDISPDCNAETLIRARVMKRTITEIYVEVEEIVEMRLAGTKRTGSPDAPATIEQFVCPHCGRAIHRIEKLETEELKK